MIAFKGNCHCKAVQFSIKCNNLIDIIRCNCSICFPLDYLHLIIPHQNFKLHSGKSMLKKYIFETKKAVHLFCQKCGIKSFYQPRSHPDSYSVNFRCLENAPKVRRIIQFNGKNFEEAIKKLNI